MRSIIRALESVAHAVAPKRVRRRQCGTLPRIIRAEPGHNPERPFQARRNRNNESTTP